MTVDEEQDACVSVNNKKTKQIIVLYVEDTVLEDYLDENLENEKKCYL